MNFYSLNSTVELLAMVFSVEIAALFGAIYLRGRIRQEHLIFSLFNVSLAVLAACRLLMQTGIRSRHIALLAFQWQCVAGCCAVATFSHFTCLVTDHRIRKYLSPRVIYLMAALFFTPPVLHLAPYGADPGHFDDLEAGPLFLGFAALVITCGIMPCYLLISTVRKLRILANMSPPVCRAAMPGNPAGEAPDLVLLRRHLELIFRGMLVLMILNLVDLVWFLNPISDLPVSFGAIGMIFLSLTIACVLGKDIIRGETRKVHLEAISQARLLSVNDAEHQLKNQMAAILRPLKTATHCLDTGVESDVLKATLADAITSTEELRETLANMLNIARVEAGKELNLGDKTAVDLAALLEALCRKCADMKDAAGLERYHIESVLPTRYVFLKGKLLEQVLYNLIDNAFNYSPDHSLIRVHIGVVEDARTLIVRISDQGKGVAEEDQERIFNEPFYRGTADTPARGTGLGLNMARRYVEAMGGNLRVESDGLDLGSTFVVTLPYQPGRSVEDTLQN